MILGVETLRAQTGPGTVLPAPRIGCLHSFKFHLPNVLPLYKTRKECQVIRDIEAKVLGGAKSTAEEGEGGDEESSKSKFRRHKPLVPPSGLSSNLIALGERESEVVRLLAEGKSSKEIAPLMDITVKTVETYRARILRKLDLHSVGQLIRYAVINKIVQF